MRILPFFLAAPFVLVAATAHADTQSGLEVGLRTGVSLPLGEAEAAQPMSDLVSAVVPLWLDVGYRFSDRFSVGLYGQYGYAFLPHVSGESNSAYDLRIGVLATYRFLLDKASYVPWIAAGIGWEEFSAKSTQSAPDGSSPIHTHVTSTGVELLAVHGGVDWPLASGLRVGPFASLSVAEYLSHGGSSDTPELEVQTGSIDSKALHLWLMLGFRGAYAL